MCPSCGGGNVASELTKTPEFAPKDQHGCRIEKSQDKPLIVEWPSADRSELESKVRRGLVVVHYVGCDMSVLSRCTVPATYTYQATTRKQDKLEVKDEDDLYANFPVGAAKLEGKLQRSGRLTVDMNIVGRFEADRPTVMASDLQGDCSGATHFVYGVTVGAFDFYAGGKADVSGSAGIGAVGARGGSQSEREDVTRDGEVSACSKATTGDKAPPESCGALIRIEVVPIQGAAGAAQNAVNGQTQAYPSQQPGYSAQPLNASQRASAGHSDQPSGSALRPHETQSQTPDGSDYPSLPPISASGDVARGSAIEYPPCVAPPSQADSDAAHASYLRGKQAFGTSNYVVARASFVDALGRDCLRVELLLYIARASELLGDQRAAVHALETYLARSQTLSADEKERFQRRIATLKGTLGPP
jgi:hypothetical protein